MGFIDWLLLLSITAFVITFAVTTIIGVIRKKKDKNIEKGEKVNGSDSNINH